MSKNTSKKQEFNHFSKLAAEWWKKEGKFKILHQIIIPTYYIKLLIQIITPNCHINLLHRIVTQTY